MTTAREPAPGPQHASPGRGPSDAELLARFSARRDQEAFTALVHRHGPLVLGVCRRVLGDRHRAEDAFQVTFLVLAQKAAALDRPGLLANWLYGVAYRTALKVREQQARRRETERRGARMSREVPAPPEAGKDLGAALDEELGRLPEKYHAPLVLCYLGGKTNTEAAQLLGRPPGSISRLLAKGRQLLRRRLAARCGVEFDLRYCARGLLAQYDAPADAVPGELAEATARAAVRYAAGPAPAGVSASAAALTEDVLRSLARRPWRPRAAVAVGVAAVLGAAVLAFLLTS